MITDGVFRLIGNKRRRGAGRSFPCAGSVGDAFLAFICACPTRACAARPRWRRPPGVYRCSAGLPCTG